MRAETEWISLAEAIAAHMGEVQGLVRAMYEQPEIGGREYAAHDRLSAYMEEQGFCVERHVAMETGFTAIYDSGKAGPCILYPAELDALPGVGHGCGHNLFTGFSLLAALGLKELLDRVGGRVMLAGTPAEENLGGKIQMAEAGVFNACSAALMIHPGTKNQMGSQTMALYPLRFEFFGKSAHASRPDEGASALDAAVEAFLSINMLRQFSSRHVQIHGVIRNGGEAANVIPAYASLEYYFRAPQMKTAVAVAGRAKKRAEAAALANGCSVKISVHECPYGELLVNSPLNAILEEAFRRQGIEDIAPYDPNPSGSSDVGALSFRFPTVQAYLRIAPETVRGHSKEMADATVAPETAEVLRKGAQALAEAGLQLILEPESLARCQSAWREAQIRDKA